MNIFSVREALKFGWHTFSQRPWFFLLLFIGLMVINGLISWATDPKHQDNSALSLLFFIASTLLGAALEIGLLNITLKAHDSVETVKLSDAYSVFPFWPYLGAKILTSIVILIGLVLLIVPGIIAGLALMFSTYLVIDKGLGPIEGMKESLRITKGHRWRLFLFMLAVIGVNVVGLLLIVIGLLVTIPVTYLAAVHVYRALERGAGEAAVAS